MQTQPTLPTLDNLFVEMRERRYTVSVVALAALVALHRRVAQGESVNANAWNHAWALAEKAVPHLHEIHIKEPA